MLDPLKEFPRSAVVFFCRYQIPHIVGERFFKSVGYVDVVERIVYRLRDPLPL